MDEISDVRDVSPNVVIVTGLSGSGKSTVVRALEDLGFFCIDNLPVPLFPKVLELAKGPKSGPNLQNFAFVVDTRERTFLSQADEMVQQLRAEGVPVEVVFLDTNDDRLIQRYSETRRPHPMSEGGTVRDGIQRERRLLEDLRQHADLVVDTSTHTVHTLKALITERFSTDTHVGLQINVLSFGFKYGLPPECDLVFDVRFLPNPYFVEGMRERTGLETDVKDYVLGAPEAGGILQILRQVGEFMLPLYEREGKSYLTVGIGCTGGRHRSVAISEAIAMRWRGRGWNVQTRHRDVQK
jgi:UPF0042 nucleotide-binding protein